MPRFPVVVLAIVVLTACGPSHAPPVPVAIDTMTLDDVAEWLGDNLEPLTARMNSRGQSGIQNIKLVDCELRYRRVRTEGGRYVIDVNSDVSIPLAAVNDVRFYSTQVNAASVEIWWDVTEEERSRYRLFLVERRGNVAATSISFTRGNAVGAAGQVHAVIWRAVELCTPSDEVSP